MNCRRILPLSIMLSLATAATLPAQEAESRLLPAAVGSVTGVAAGGYIALSIIVAEARMERYIHDIDDVLGWRSMPVVAGALIGGALGVFSPQRLESTIVYGAAGFGAGVGLGMGVGSLVWEPPEGRWAGAAIGAGLGLVIGNVYGLLNPLREEDEAGIFFSVADGVRAAAARPGVPVLVRVRF